MGHRIRGRLCPRCTPFARRGPGDDADVSGQGHEGVNGFALSLSFLLLYFYIHVAVVIVPMVYSRPRCVSCFRHLEVWIFRTRHFLAQGKELDRSRDRPTQQLQSLLIMK